MLKIETLMDQGKAAQRASEEGPTTAFESEERRLRQFVAIYAIGCTLGPDTWISDVQKRRVVTVLQLVGQHASQYSGSLQGCSTCLSLEQALLALAAYGMPLGANGCQHIIGASHLAHAQDYLAGAVHKVSVPISLIHRISRWPEDASCESRCVAEFRSRIGWFGVPELFSTEAAERDDPWI